MQFRESDHGGHKRSRVAHHSEKGALVLERRAGARGLQHHSYRSVHFQVSNHFSFFSPFFFLFILKDLLFIHTLQNVSKDQNLLRSTRLEQYALYAVPFQRSVLAADLETRKGLLIFILLISISFQFFTLISNKNNKNNKIEAEKGSQISYLFRSPFSGGNVFSATMLDTLLYQSFVKNYLISFVRLMLGIDQAPGSGHLSSVSKASSSILSQTN
jgi:hypothetical protein